MIYTAAQHFKFLVSQGMPYRDALRSASFRFGVATSDLEKAAVR